MNQIRHAVRRRLPWIDFCQVWSFFYPCVESRIFWLANAEMNTGIELYNLAYKDVWPPAWDPETLYFIDVTIDVV